MLAGCEQCGKIIDFNVRFMYNDMVMCGTCFSFRKDQDKAAKLITLPPNNKYVDKKPPKWQDY